MIAAEEIQLQQTLQKKLTECAEPANAYYGCV